MSGKSAHRCTEALWKDYFKDPSWWWDNRHTKLVPTYPDFKHKLTKDALWVDNWYNPSWVFEELQRRAHAQEQEPSADKENAFCNKCILRKDDETALLTSLRACAKHRDLSRGTHLHDDILNRGSLERFSDDLIIMYAKCGELSKAKELLDVHKSRDVFSWTALIGGYAQKGQGHNALYLFEKMQLEGLSPDAAAFVCALQACSCIQAADKGAQIHDQISREGLLENNVLLGTALVDMYVKCGDLNKAQKALDGLLVRNVISWNALLAGYAQHDQGEQALQCYQRMQCEGLTPDATTYSCLLKACGTIQAADKGEEIHDEISRKGLLKDNSILGNSLVDMYAKCSAFDKARQVLEELSLRNVVAWTSLIAAYVKVGQGQNALDCLEAMRQDGLSPDVVTFTCILTACGSTIALDKGEQIHEEIKRGGFLRTNIALGNALVDMYAKCRAFTKAEKVLEDLPVRDVLSWNALLAGYVQEGQAEEALDCYERMRHEGIAPDAATYVCVLKACGCMGVADMGEQLHEEITRRGLFGENIVLGNALIDMYAKCGALEKARGVLDELAVRDVVSWNAIIAGYAQQGQGEEALQCFERMHGDGLSPDTVTFVGILNACGSMQSADRGEWIHDIITKQGLLGSNTVLGTALVDMYAKCGALEKAQHVLEELSPRDVVSWNALVAGYIHHGKGEQALSCYEQMKREGLSPDASTFLCILKACGSMGAANKGEEIHEEIGRHGLLGSNGIIGSALVDMYLNCGALAKAELVLDELRVQDVTSWSTLMAGYAQQDQPQQALACFERMQDEGLSPSEANFACILKACGSIGAVDKGEHVHHEIVRQAMLKNSNVLGTAVVDMYAKCGALTKARQVLEEFCPPSVATWNALLAGYAQQGHGEQALISFERMEQEGVTPDAVTFSCVLNACSQLGQVDDAEMYFENMSENYGIKPELEHYTCMAGLLGRVGLLDKAAEVIKLMPSSQYAEVWSTLLSACRRWGDPNVGRWAFENAVQVNESDVTSYVLMADIYSVAGMQEDAEKIRAMGVRCEALEELGG